MSAHLATPSNNRGDLMPEPPATHGHEWLCCEGCLVCHRLASLIVKVSTLCCGPTARGVCRPCQPRVQGDTWLQSAPESLAIALAPKLRSHTSRVTLPKKLLRSVKERISSEGEVLKSSSPREASRDRRLRGPTSRLAPIGERSTSPH